MESITEKIDGVVISSERIGMLKMFLSLKRSGLLYKKIADADAQDVVDVCMEQNPPRLSKPLSSKRYPNG